MILIKNRLGIVISLLFTLALMQCSENPASNQDDGLGGPDPTTSGQEGILGDAGKIEGGIGVCTGKVVDYYTRRGVPGMKVELYAGYLPMGANQLSAPVQKTAPSTAPATNDNETVPVTMKQVDLGPTINQNANENSSQTSPLPQPTTGNSTIAHVQEDHMGVTKSIITSQDNPNTAIDEAGTFIFTGLPEGSFPLYVDGFQYFCSTGTSGGAQGFSSYVQVYKVPTMPITVAVTNNSVPVSGAVVSAQLQSASPVGTPDQFQDPVADLNAAPNPHETYALSPYHEVSAVTNAQGIATLNVSRVHSYLLFASGGPNLITTSKMWSYGQTSQDAVAIDLISAGNYKGIELVNVDATVLSGEGFGAKDAIVSGGMNVLVSGKDGTSYSMEDILLLTGNQIRLTFNAPISEISPQVNIVRKKLYRQHRVFDTALDENNDGFDDYYGKEYLQQLSCTLALANTQLVCNLPGGDEDFSIQHMEPFQLSGYVTFNKPSNTKTDASLEEVSLSNLNGGKADYWVIYNPTEEFALTVDNYNGSETDDTLAASALFIRTSHLIYGDYEIDKYTFKNAADENETIELANVCKDKLNGGELVYDRNYNCKDENAETKEDRACRSGIHYRIDLAACGITEQKDGTKVNFTILDVKNHQGTVTSGSGPITVK